MPSRFDPDHVHRHFILSEAFCQLLHMVLITAPVYAVPHTETPHGRQTAASRKQVVPHHGFFHVSCKEIQFDTARCRNLNDDLPFFPGPLKRVQRRFTEFLMRNIYLPFPYSSPYKRWRTDMYPPTARIPPSRRKTEPVHGSLPYPSWDQNSP